MSYTVEDVKDVISRYEGEAEFFRLSLLNHEAVEFANLGFAFLVQQQEEWNDQDEGDIYFVFRIETEYGNRWFKIDGWRSSYDGDEFWLRSLREVKATPQIRHTWEKI